MSDKKCKYLVREGVCNGFLDTCCIHQRISILGNREGLKGIDECYCDRDYVNPNKEYVTAIHDLAALANGGGLDAKV